MPCWRKQAFSIMVQTFLSPSLTLMSLKKLSKPNKLWGEHLQEEILHLKEALCLQNSLEHLEV